MKEVMDKTIYKDDDVIVRPPGDIRTIEGYSGAYCRCGHTLHIKTPKVKAFIIGPISREDYIEKVARHYVRCGYHEVRYVYHQPDKSLEELINEAYKNIEWADEVIVVRKEEGWIGTGTLYEYLYAKRLGKIVTILPVNFLHNQEVKLI